MTISDLTRSSTVGVVVVSPPAGSAATEDGDRRYFEDSNVSEMSDKYPAGRLLSPAEDRPNVQGSAGRKRPDWSAEGPVPEGPRTPGSRVSAGRVGAAAETPGHGVSLRRERRTVSLDVRLTTSEREAIRVRARVLGVKPSAWSRAVMRDALDARSHALADIEQTAAQHELAPELGEAVEQLRRVGSNLNQAVRSFHQAGSGGPDVALLSEVAAAVVEVRASLGDRTRT